MARPLRIQYPGATYHIISRGIARMTIFHTEKDWSKFIGFMERVITRYRWICHAYCLMGNHYHILIETPDANMVPGMKQLNQLYSQFYNWKYHRVGPVLQGRYKAWLVQREEKFLDNCRYIVNNPGEAKMVEHPSQWPWSSFRATRGMDPKPPFLNTDFLLSRFSTSRKKARTIYEEFVLAGIGMESPLEKARNQIFMGSDAFIAEVIRHVHERDELNNVPRAHKTAGRPALGDIFNNSIMTSKKTRNHLILQAYDVHAYTQREIGEFLHLYPGYISRIILRLRKG